MADKPIKILFAGGGTAGHIFPIIAVKRAISKNYPQDNFKFFYVGPQDDFGGLLLSQEGIEVKTILAGKIRRYFEFKSFFSNLIDIFLKAPISFFQALFYNFILSPDIIFSKGGYGSLPLVLSGWFLLIPIFLHESDAMPGLANKIASKFAVEIFTSFPIEKTSYFPPKKMIAVGNPIRTELLGGTKEEAKKVFNLTGEKPVVLVLGGSQGSQRINDNLLLVLAETLESFEIIHQTGKNNFQQVEAEAKVVASEKLRKYYHPIPFLQEEELRQALAVSELVVSRAGSGSIFEIAATGKPSILIPIPESAQDHQVKNAYLYAEKGAALVIEESNLTPHFFLERTKFLFSQEGRLKEMSENARYFSKTQSAQIIAEYLVTYLSQ